MKKILLIEDEEDYQHLIGQILESKFNLICASSGEEGMENLKKDPADMIILDINLPKMSGWEALEKIRNSSEPKIKNCPVIMLTVKKEDEDVIKGLDNGADDYIVKPFEPKELLSRINAILMRAGGM